MSDPIDYRETMTFLWLDIEGFHTGVCVIDGRDYESSQAARAAIDEAVAEVKARLPFGNYRVSRRDETELKRWPGWREFRERVRVYGPVAPFHRIRAADPVPAKRFWQHHGQLVFTFPDGDGPEDEMIGRRAEGYGLNPGTGEFEPDTLRAVEVAHGADDDETWPMDRNEFVREVERERAGWLTGVYYQRREKPDIFALYDSAVGADLAEDLWRRTAELWEQALAARAYYLVDGEPVRVGFGTAGALETVSRLNTVTGRIEASPGMLSADGMWPRSDRVRRVTEQAYIMAVEQRRRAVSAIPADIAVIYAEADAVGGRRAESLAVRSFDLWARHWDEGGQH